MPPKKLDLKSIKEFANDINIHPGIVVGRLQHDGLLPMYMHNDLKSRYTVVDEQIIYKQKEFKQTQPTSPKTSDCRLLLII